MLDIILSEDVINAEFQIDCSLPYKEKHFCPDIISLTCLQRSKGTRWLNVDLPCSHLRPSRPDGQMQV